MEKMSFSNYLDVSDAEKSEESVKKSDIKRKRNKRSRSRSKSNSDIRTNRRYKHSDRDKKRRPDNRRDRDRDKKRTINDSRSRRRKSYSKSSSSSSSSSSSPSKSKSSSGSDRSRSKTRKHKSRENKNKSRSVSKSPYRKERNNIPKWSTIEGSQTDTKRIITLKHKKGDLQINEIEPNDNIPINTEEKEKPNFEASGLLAKQTNTLNGTVLKFTEPLDASQPNEDWRLYTFKDSNSQDILHISKKSVYLIGKDDRAADILVNHPSSSRQHAVIQFRKVSKNDSEGNIQISITPYIMDLESTNGTMLNKKKIEPARYYELKPYDIINIGLSNRDYVVMKVDKNPNE